MSDSRMSKHTPLSATSAGRHAESGTLRARIARKAYELFETRGRAHGRDREDWLEAERIVLTEMQVAPDAADVAPARAATRPAGRAARGRRPHPAH